MESIVMKENIEQFKKEFKLFDIHKNPMLSNTPTKLEVSGYLKLCEIQRIDKLIKILEAKS